MVVAVVRAAVLPLFALHVVDVALSTTNDGWFVDPITVKVMHDRRVPFASSAQKIDLAGQRGECERAQLWGWADEEDLTDV
eukprot:COSAG02_NODE_30049_length_561_cov_0.869281_1_plen_80_part_01